MFEYRVTKYDPTNRKLDGRYTADEWTSWSQVGQEVGGRVLTVQDYWKVEDAYVIAAMQMLSESGVDSLVVRGLENASGYEPETFDLCEGSVMKGNELQHALRCLLREYFWCRLEGGEGAYIHVGWDYYMYVGVPRPVPESRRIAREAGLFVEVFESPYKLSSGGEQPN